MLVRTLSMSDPQRLLAVESTDPKTTQPTGFYGDAFTVFQASQGSFAAGRCTHQAWIASAPAA